MIGVRRADLLRAFASLLLREGEILADDTLPSLLSQTGAVDAEGAFLALIDRAQEAAR